MFLIWTTYGTLNFHDAGRRRRRAGPDAAGHPERCTSAAAWPRRSACCCCSGACGKSAQFPLHVWLPDAMEGPTPVSALIHAATMVTAGVYMVARCTPLFMASPDAQHGRGRASAASRRCSAGVIALTQTDLKRVLAYSTVSQLGYMFLGLGAGTLAGITAGMFHLFTHAFFKALLFLGAGSVMHAMGGVIDMRRFGGLRRLMPITHWTFLFGCLALAGVVPFAGFWSKDAILAAVHERGRARARCSTWLYCVGAVHGLPDGVLHVPRVLPDVLRPRARSARGRASCPRVAAGDDRAAGDPGGLRAGRRRLFRMDRRLCRVPGAHAVAGLSASSRRARPSTPAVAHDWWPSSSTVVALAGVGLAAFLYLGDRAQVDGARAAADRPLYCAVVRQVLLRPDLQRAVRLAAAAAGAAELLVRPHA